MKQKVLILILGIAASSSYANVWSWFGNSAGDDGNANTQGNGAYVKPTPVPSNQSLSTKQVLSAAAPANSNVIPLTPTNDKEISYEDSASLPPNKNTHLCIVNATNRNMIIDHVSVDNGDWDGPNPHTILPGTVIPALQSVCKKMLINNFRRSAPVEPFIKISGVNNTVLWRTDQFDILDYNNAVYTPNNYISKDSDPGQYKLTRLTGHFANTFIISDKQYDNETFLSSWMSKIPTSATLKDVMMMGSHDAGVAEDDSVITFGIGGYARNTITQKYGILDQLKSGVRYFDMRVDSLPTNNAELVADKSSGKVVLLDTGDTLVPVHSGKGCTSGDIGGAYTRKTLDATMFDIVSFIKTHTSETVILNFSHQCDNDTVNANIKLLGDILDKYSGDYYYKSNLDNFSANWKMKDLRGKIVILLDGHGYETLVDPKKGYYTLHNLYDDYANKSAAIDVQSDQLAKLNSFKNRANESSTLFLLNWTSTVATMSIQAGSAMLYPTLANSLAKVGKDNPQMPNIVNVDFVNPMMGSLIIQRYYKNSNISY